MNLANRIARLEEQLRNASNPIVPVFRIALGGGDEAEPFRIEHAGKSWVQRNDESLEQLYDRVMPEAMAHAPPRGQFPTLALVAQRLPISPS